MQLLEVIKWISLSSNATRLPAGGNPVIPEKRIQVLSISRIQHHLYLIVHTLLSNHTHPPVSWLALLWAFHDAPSVTGVFHLCISTHCSKGGSDLSLANSCRSLTIYEMYLNDAYQKMRLPKT